MASTRPPRSTSEVPPELSGALVGAGATARAPEPVARAAKADAPVVLVVEDDESIRSLVVRALGTLYTVYEAKDGEQASQILDAIAAPACIVSDVMMPRMDGLTLVKKIKTTPSLKWTPVIFLTAKNHPLEVVQGINAGARHYLSKPFKMKELMDKVASVVASAKR